MDGDQFTIDYGIMAFIGFGLLFGLLSLIYHGHHVRVSKERAWAEKETPHWQKLMAKWNSLYYCHRCDGVFFPGQSHLIPSVRMKDYLYEV